MSKYEMYGLSLSDAQTQKIRKASDKIASVTIRLSKNNLSGSYELPLTQTQINRIRKTETGLDLTLSCAQMKQLNKEHKKKTGGLIPLLSLIPIIAGVLGAAGGVSGGIASAVSAAKNAKAADTAQTELERHNREIEKQMKEGSGVIGDVIGKAPKIGKYLKPLLEKLGLGVSDCDKVISGGCVKCGEGLFLRPFGSGIFLGPPPS
jgi:hypothetical protein